MVRLRKNGPGRVIEQRTPRATRAMEMPFVIAIDSISGGGKTSLSKFLRKKLPKSRLFCFDDFEKTNTYPKDFHLWYLRGADLLEFDLPEMAGQVKRAIEQNSNKFIILDYPFGRKHPRLSKQIDLTIYIDTPLDVAMARRILRGIRSPSITDASFKVKGLRKDLADYLQRNRLPYLGHRKRGMNSDLVLDGCESLETNCQRVLSFLRKKNSH